MRDLESILACIVRLHSLLRDSVGEDMQSTNALQRQESSCTRAHTHSTHACTHTSKYIIVHAHEVSEVTMTSPNHAVQYIVM